MALYIKRAVFHALALAGGVVCLPVFLVVSILSRFMKKSFDVGLGPEPLINNVYHKRALEGMGYSAETFVNQVYFITDEFDIRGDLALKSRILKPFRNYYLFIVSLLRYRCVYVYFNGGPLGFTIFWRLEPFFYKLAGVKVVVMPYGGDVQELTRSPNLSFKDAMARDYPSHRLWRGRIAARIDLWTRRADHLVGGCDWVDYMYYWSTLMLGHFSIDTDAWRPAENRDESVDRPLRILHAPNHRAIKGTAHFIKAVEELKAEGVKVELVLLERVPNAEIKKAMASVDMVADQLVIGWYAMFAIEAMAMGKPVLCYLRQDLKELYAAAGLIGMDEIPIINCTPFTVKEEIRRLADNKDGLKAIGARSRAFVIRHHSLDYIGEVLSRINGSLGILPHRRGRHD